MPGSPSPGRPANSPPHPEGLRRAAPRTSVSGKGQALVMHTRQINMINKVCLGMAVLAVVISGLGLYVWRQTPFPPSTSPVEKIIFGTGATGIFPALVWIGRV